MNEKYIPLSVPNLKGNELKYITEAVKTEWVSTSGPFVISFEEKIAKYVNVRHAISCQNGTAGLYMSLILCGIKPGDEVLVPTLTFIAPVNVIKYVGAEPVFMDCDSFMNIDPEKTAEFLEKECRKTGKGAQNKRTGKIIKAIIPVHIFGNGCNMIRLTEIAKEFHLKIIEDASESLGTYYTEGRLKNKFTGAIGDTGVFSFNGNKIITTGGGGMIVTNDDKLAQKAKYLTTQAKDDHVRYIHNEIGFNFRMTNLQAALGIAQIEQLEKFIEIKRRNYKLYKEHLDRIKGLQLWDIPQGMRVNHWFYSLVVDSKKFGMDREKLMNELTTAGIQSRPIWFLNHRQKPYRKNQSFKIERAFWFWERALNLPCSTNLKERDVRRVISAIKMLER